MDGRVLLNRELLSNLLGIDRRIRLALDEVGQQAVPVLSRITELGPVGVVALTTAVPEHTVQHRPASKHTTLRYVSRLAIKVNLRHRGEVPVVDTANVVADESWYRDQRRAIICWAGFEEEDVDTWIFGEAVGYCKTGWAASNDCWSSASSSNALRVTYRCSRMSAVEAS